MAEPQNAPGCKAGNADVEAMGEAGPRESSKASYGPPQPSLGQPPRCPECGSAKVWRDGLRRLTDGLTVQRWFCRSCGYRFSHPKVKLNVLPQPLKSLNPESNFLDADITRGYLAVKERYDPLPLQRCEDVAPHIPSEGTVAEKNLNISGDYNRNRRVCASEVGAKNSASQGLSLMENAAEVEKRAAGATETSQRADIKGKLVEFAWWMKKQGYAESTITRRVKALEVLYKRGANLYDPESVKEVISKQSWSDNGKDVVVRAYSCFLKMVGGSWKPPIVREVEKLPFIPTEQELDSLIAAARGKLAVFLQLLKETGMRAGEAWSLKWTDIDLENGTVRVTPEKGSRARCFKLSARLLAMLNRLERKSEWVFKPWKLRHMRRTFERVRNRIAVQLCNPRLKLITFHTFRHWKATMEYAKTKDILYVMQVLGHKNIKNTLRYTQLVNFKEDEFICKTARTVQEAAQLIEAGFEYVCEIDGVRLFRKRK